MLRVLALGGRPILFCWDLPTIASTFVSDMAYSLVSLFYLQFSSFLETEYNLTTLAANKEQHITVA